MIYLDAAATMPIRDGVSDRLRDALQENWGTVSGSYSVSRAAKNLLEESREHLSNLLNVSPDAVVFTSGATESLNMIIQGYMRSKPESHFYYSAIEHAAVTNTAKYLLSENKKAIELKVDHNGIVDIAALENISEDDLICVMPVNNETGVINNVKTIAEIVHSKNAKILLDGVQSFYAADPRELCEIGDYIVFSGHKIGAPKGVGVAIIKDRASIDPLMFGGSQEWELRPGTTPAFLIDSFVDVFNTALESRNAEIQHMEMLQTKCIQQIEQQLPAATIHSHQVPRSPHVVAIHIPNVESQMLVSMLDNQGVCASKGSACASGATTPSHVLTAMGIEENDAKSTIRFSFSHKTTLEEVEQAVSILVQCVEKLSVLNVGSNG